MNPAAILALIAELYEQSRAQAEQISHLESELDAARLEAGLAD